MNNKFTQKILSPIMVFLKDPLFLRRWDSPDYYNYPKDANQLSVRTSSNKKRYLYVRNGDAFMFTQDMYSGIMPFMHYRGEREKYPVRLDPPSQEKECLIAEGISGRNNSYFLEDALSDFVRTTSQILYHDGVSFYEIISEKNKEGKTESFELESIQSACFFYFFGNYYQFIPWWEAKNFNTRVQIVKITKEKILRIDFPKKLGGKRKLTIIVKRLWKLSKELIPKFQMDALEKDKSIGFNTEEFSRSKYLEVAKLTKDFGWGQGQRFNDLTEYYLILRHLRAKKSEALIRDEIISKLNEAINGPNLNLGVKVSMQNIFTVKDVEDQEKKLIKGNISFSDIVNAIKI